MTESFEYAALLAKVQKEGQPKRKGEQTKDRLNLATVKLLGDVGYRDMRVSDICDQAGVSQATFYLYYENKVDITREVLSKFLQALYKLLPAEKQSVDAFESIYHANLSWLKVVRANAGLIRCMFQFGDQVREFADLVHRSNHLWYRRIATNAAHRISGKSVDETTALLASYALGSMMDEFYRRLFIEQDPHLRAIIDEVAVTDEELAEALTVLWYRAMYGTNPAKSSITSSAGKKLLRILLVDKSATESKRPKQTARSAAARR